MNRCVIVIPVHSSNPGPNELISFLQCFRILSAHPIKIIAPKGLDISAYKKLVPNLEVLYISAHWQSSILSYNKLKLSKFFYKQFSAYEFLLTYELDAFVFRDEVAYWCDKGYDFIGAPWFEGFHKAHGKIIGVGNSGFSLRKVSTFRSAINQIYTEHIYASPDRIGNTIRKSKALLYSLINVYGENYSIQKQPVLNEDHFIANFIPTKKPEFKLAPIEEAIRFSFETRPEHLYKLNGDQLPMGCHAWSRYNYSFWKPFITSFGYHPTDV